MIGYVSKASKKDLQNKEYLKDKITTSTRVGKTGLESKLDIQVLGDVGYKRYEVNAYGKRIKEISINPGKAGKNFKTTLDQEVQDLASNLLKDKSGSVCVMDIYKGDVVAMVSSPVFDPNQFVHGINNENWNKLIKHRDKPLINKSIAGLYPPGSTIKSLAVISALENDVFNPKTVIRCNGSIELYGEKFHCWKKKGHGYMDMREGLKQSCDVYFYEVARKLGIDRLSETAKKFGLGEKVLDGFIEERTGVVPNTSWKKKFIGKNWYLGETLHAGIGQGYWQSSPMQLCLMTAQIANGGFEIKPRVLTNEKKNNLREYIKYKNENPNEPLPIDMLVSNFDLNPLFRNQENINFVKDAMFAATNEAGGTSFRSRYSDKKFMFAGKTGSSQVKRFTEAQREAEIKQSELDYKDRDHALYIAFAPYDNPKYSISVVIEHGGSGSKAAAPIAQKLMRAVVDRHEERTKRNIMV